jgi:uncharacterized protein
MLRLPSVNKIDINKQNCRMISIYVGTTQTPQNDSTLSEGAGNMAEDKKYSAERAKLLDHEMKRCLRVLAEHGSAEKVILFGTLAKGSVHEWSDIDLVVVEKTQLPFFQRIKRIRKLVKPKVGMDIMVYTPEEFEQLCVDRPFFNEEIIGKGKVIYERTR